MTHVKRLRDMSASVARLEDRIAPLRESRKLGPILWQLPPTFKRDDSRLAEALAALPDGRHAFEFRHPSWFHDDVYALLGAHGSALVVADRAPDPPTPWVDTAGWSYLRFHSGRGRNGNYSRAELAAGPSACPLREATSTSTTTGTDTRCENALALRSRLTKLVPATAARRPTSR